MSPEPGYLLLIVWLFLIAMAGWLSAVKETVRTMNESRVRRLAEEGNAKAAKALPVAETQEESHWALQAAWGLTCLCAGFLTAAVLTPAVGALLQSAGMTESGVLDDALSWLPACLLLLIVCQTSRRLCPHLRESTRLRLLIFAGRLKALMRPTLAITRGVSSALLRIGGIDPDRVVEEVTEEEILAMVDIGGESGAIEADEKEMIENVLAFDNRSADEIMTHRRDVRLLQVDATREEVLALISETGLSRFPVYHVDVDDIVGILNTRDYLLELQQPHPRTLRELLREPYFVPGTVPADAIFEEMRRSHSHLAVVVDEYGGFSGIVTMEDLLEEIVGNIYDEHDRQTEAEIVPAGSNLWRVSGTATLEDVASVLHVTLPEDNEAETLAELVFSRFITVPQDGSRPEMDIDSLHIRVEKLEEHRVTQMLVSVLPQEAGGDGEDASK